ncbi:hypothetical protein AKJ49_00695 [candidate division MSBL1 archaeon SCGC-AAA382A03]|uniref:Nascent polypeptide-associated complex protein n=1 Tax=candidate division MSBL1 archaeon SCGC-AAA382A03 TaxID=1698278 RepID=A0A133VG97_9EURY|nr:hypothetical protein AKJ49_00695 [candidate division MSBL1 archaeon SCGC-AAA382A03]
MFGRGGFDSKQLKKMMKQMGVEMKELEGVEEAVIKLSDKELVFSNPQVQITEAQGQKTYQIIGEPEEQEKTTEKTEISDEDIKMVLEQADVTEEEARKALEESEGDIAQAIVNLKES